MWAALPKATFEIKETVQITQPIGLSMTFLEDWSLLPVWVHAAGGPMFLMYDVISLFLVPGRVVSPTARARQPHGCLVGLGGGGGGGGVVWGGG